MKREDLLKAIELENQRKDIIEKFTIYFKIPDNFIPDSTVIDEVNNKIIIKSSASPRVHYLSPMKVTMDFGEGNSFSNSSDKEVICKMAKVYIDKLILELKKIDSEIASL